LFALFGKGVEANIGLLLSRTECMWLETCPFKSSIETGHISIFQILLLQHCGVDILLTPSPPAALLARKVLEMMAVG
jgi:hypothetical protein